MERMMTEDKGGNDVVIDAQRRCEHDENILAEVKILPIKAQLILIV